MAPYTNPLDHPRAPEPWTFGAVAAEAIITVLAHSEYALKSYTKASHVMAAWYDAKSASNVALL